MDCAGLLIDMPPTAKNHILFNGATAKAGFGGQVKLVKSLQEQKNSTRHVSFIVFYFEISYPS